MFSKKDKREEKTPIETNVRDRVFNAGVLAKSLCEFGRSCDPTTRSKLFVVVLGSRANAELVPKFHVALHASHAALPMVTLQISPQYAPPKVGLKLFRIQLF
jgi:hypothetical protein